MPEIKPVEPDPDNAGVGNSKTKVCNSIAGFCSKFMGKKSGLCEKL
jgi:hypothetical protein